MRIISVFLIACLLLPLLPGRSVAQLVPGALNVPAAASIATGGRGIPAPIVAGDYVLGVGDQLEAHLIVGDNALVLDYTFTINPQGKIFFPNVAAMTLSGLTLKQGRARMAGQIRKKYSEKFDLSLMVSVPKTINIFVTGQVDSPGLSVVYDGTRIADVLKGAGVAKGGSDLSESVYVKRQTGDGEVETLKLSLYEIFLGSDGKQNIALKNGDIIAMPAIKSYVYVYGDIARSGTYGYVPGQTLSDYINMAGGPTNTANLSGVTVTRQENGKPRVYHVNASDILRKGMNDKDIEIFAGDVINVPGNFFYVSSFTSFLNTILLTLTLYTTLAK